MPHLKYSTLSRCDEMQSSSEGDTHFSYLGWLIAFPSVNPEAIESPKKYLVYHVPL